jgi:cytochrome c oxidase subunit II
LRIRRPWISAALGGVFICIGLLLGARNLMRWRTAPALTVRAIAHQWWWEFDYPFLGIKTRDELDVPSNSVVRFELTSADVVHTFWMPGMSKAVPVAPGEARVLTLKMRPPGESYGTCGVTCGCGSVCMRFRVFASPERQFRKWVARTRLQPPGVAQVRSADVVPECISKRASPIARAPERRVASATVGRTSGLGDHRRPD